MGNLLCVSLSLSQNVVITTVRNQLVHTSVCFNLDKSELNIFINPFSSQKESCLSVENITYSLILILPSLCERSSELQSR